MKKIIHNKMSIICLLVTIAFAVVLIYSINRHHEYRAILDKHFNLKQAYTELAKNNWKTTQDNISLARKHNTLGQDFKAAQLKHSELGRHYLELNKASDILKQKNHEYYNKYRGLEKKLVIANQEEGVLKKKFLVLHKLLDQKNQQLEGLVQSNLNQKQQLKVATNDIKRNYIKFTNTVDLLNTQLESKNDKIKALESFKKRLLIK